MRKDKKKRMLTIGQAMQKARTDKSLTRHRLCEMAGVAYVSLTNWENDKAVPNVLSLTAIADVLRVSLDELVGRKFERSEKGICSLS